MLQDTVIAMQALSEYAKATKDRVTDLTITVKNLKHQGDKPEVELFTDADKNREVIHAIVSLVLPW